MGRLAPARQVTSQMPGELAWCVASQARYCSRVSRWTCSSWSSLLMRLDVLVGRATRHAARRSLSPHEEVPVRLDPPGWDGQSPAGDDRVAAGVPGPAARDARPGSGVRPRSLVSVSGP